MPKVLLHQLTTSVTVQNFYHWQEYQKSHYQKEMLKENFQFLVVRKIGYFRENFTKEDIEKFRTIFTEKVKCLNFYFLWPCDLYRKWADAEILNHFSRDFRLKKTLSCLICLGRCYFFGMKCFLAFSNAVKFIISAVFIFSRVFLW